MGTVVILGAGDLGGALGRQLAALDIVSRIVLVDDAGGVAAGKALDISQAGPVDRHAPSVTGTNDLSAVTGAVIILVADQAGQTPTEWQGDAGLALIRRAAGFNQTAPILCAGARQQELIEAGVSELGIERTRLIGSAPEALRAAVIAMTALEAAAAPQEVALLVLGRPPDGIIVPWDQVSVAGRPATHVLSVAQLARLDARVGRLWPPGPATLAAAAGRFVRTALTRAPRTHVAWVSLTRDEGAAGRVAMMPVMLNAAGLARLMAPALSARDHVRLDTTLRG